MDARALLEDKHDARRKDLSFDAVNNRLAASEAGAARWTSLASAKADQHAWPARPEGVPET